MNQDKRSAPSAGKEAASTDSNRIRILIADDHPIVRDGLAGVAEEQNDMVVVGQVGTGLEALALYREHRPDVTLMDLRMPGTSGWRPSSPSGASFRRRV